MHLTRRMRLIWHKLWLIPLVGATADVVASEAAKLGGVTVPIPWLFSAIGVAGMLGAAVVRAYSVPLIPEGLETPDEALTRRSRVLGERLGATPVRVFVSDLPKLRGKVDTFIDGHDLFVSERVAALPEAERDFVLARALVERSPAGRLRQRKLAVMLIFGGLAAALTEPWITITLLQADPWWQFAVPAFLFWVPFLMDVSDRLGPDESRTWSKLALQGTGEVTAAMSALQALACTPAQRKEANQDVASLEKWWKTTGQKAVETSEWYQKELAMASETNDRSSQSISGDSSFELPASETN